MMNFDYRKLRASIKEKYGTQEKFAKALGIGYVSLSKRLNGALQFSQNEIKRAIEILGLPCTSIPEFFFDQKVQIAEHLREAERK